MVPTSLLLCTERSVAILPGSCISCSERVYCSDQELTPCRFRFVSFDPATTAAGVSFLAAVGWLLNRERNCVAIGCARLSPGMCRLTLPASGTKMPEYVVLCAEDPFWLT